MNAIESGNILRKIKYKKYYIDFLTRTLPIQQQ